jgi:hypothetical protein
MVVFPLLSRSADVTIVFPVAGARRRRATVLPPVPFPPIAGPLRQGTSSAPSASSRLGHLHRFRDRHDRSLVPARCQGSVSNCCFLQLIQLTDHPPDPLQERGPMALPSPAAASLTIQRS